MRQLKTIHLFALAAATIWLSGCGGGSKTPPPPPAVISVALSGTPPTTLIAATTASLTASVSNDSSNGGVKWTVSCSASACGSFSPTSTASGAATTYTAPATPPTSPATVTVTATSVTDSTKAASTTITITAAAPGITVAFSAQPPTSLVISATTSITAVVSNDSKSAGVTWTVTCGSSGACGSFSPASTASGTATTYTAPSTIPNPATVTVTATSVTDTTKSASATITINNILNNGTYVFHASGQDATGPYFLAGAFTVQNGAITGGEQDFADPAIAPTNTLVASGSALTAAGGNIQIVLNTGNSALGVNGLETFRGARVSASRVLISEFDTFGSGTGSIDLQTGTAAPSGGYAFNLNGLDASGSPLVVGGVLNITGTTISNTASVLDFNDAGIVGQKQQFSSGSVTAPDSFGRLTFTLTPNTTSLNGFVLNGYIVGTNQIQLVEALNDPLNGDLGGLALGQGSHTGNFTAANAGNATYVFTGLGADAATGGLQHLHIGASFSLNTDLSVTGTLAVNDLSTVGSAAIATGAYTVDSTGRVTITNVTPSIVQGIPFIFQLYLDGNGNALELGVDTSEATAGLAYLQTVTSPVFAGNYAFAGQGFGVLSNSEPAWGAVGPVAVASTSITGFTDYTLQGAATPTSNVTLTGTETSGTATLTLSGLNATSAQTANSYNYFPIDAKRIIAIETDGGAQGQFGLLQLEGISP
jgi:hypothetical protein